MINNLLIKRVLLLRETPKDVSAVQSPQCLKSFNAPETPVSMLPPVCISHSHSNGSIAFLYEFYQLPFISDI